MKEEITLTERQNVDTRLREMRRILTRAIVAVDPEGGAPLNAGYLDGLLDVVDVHMQAINAELGRR